MKKSIKTNIKNKAINATNPRITGNIKLVVDTSGQMYFESINSSDWLSKVSYKGYKYNDNLSYNTNLRNFINQNIGTKALFDIVDVSSINNTNNLYDQYNYLYDAGCYSEESQLIQENFRFFAPIHIEDTSNLPEYFVILKTDAVENSMQAVLNSNYSVVESFDLKNINSRVLSTIEDSGLVSDVHTLKVTGFDISLGSVLTKLEDCPIDDHEQTITEANNWFTNAYKRNNMLYTNIVNLEFAFTDEQVDGQFVKYVGFYVSLHEHEQIAELAGSLRLTKTKDAVLKYDKNRELSAYFGREFSVVGSSFGQRKQAILEIDMLTNPEPYTLIQIHYNDQVDASIVLPQEVISKNVNTTILNIAQYINENYNGTKSIVRAEVHDNMLRLLTNNLLDNNETLKFTSSSKALNVRESKLGTRTNEFIRPDDFTILSSGMYLNAEKFTHVMFEIDGEKQYIKVVDVDDYLGQNMYRLAAEVPKLQAGEMFWLVEELKESSHVCSILEMGHLDMNTEINNHKTVYDYSAEDFRNYYYDEVAANPEFKGSAAAYFDVDESNLTATQIAEYKNLIGDKFLQYIDTVETITKPFIKSINTTTFISEMVESSYDRLMENAMPALRRVNRLYPFINKWSAGLDSTNNPNMLNFALPYKHENFNASHVELNRDVFKNTHDWFVLCDGLPNYELKQLHQKQSYSAYPIDDDSFENVEFDAYDQLIHTDDSNIVECFVTAKYDSLQKASFAYFKGVKYRIEKNIDNYRFAVVVKTSTQLLDDVFTVKAVKNDKFETYTIFINFYIPEPILTTFERDQRYYFIDKSLMYYSNEVYASLQNSVDFGTDKISVDLYNTTEQKRYLGELLPHTNWFHNTGTETLLYVKRGNAGIFGTSFSDMLNVGDNFKISYTSDDDQESPWYGMEIEFFNIAEVSTNHFWCRQIIVRSNLNVDVANNDNDGWLLDENTLAEIINYDIYQMYQANNNLFFENNIAYISKAIAYELCVYSKIITQKANNARYKELCLSNFKQYLKANQVDSNAGNVRIYIEDMNIGEISVSIQAENNDQTMSTVSTQTGASFSYSGAAITKLPTSYSYVVCRQNLVYKPLITPLQKYYDLDDIPNVYPFESMLPRLYKKIVSKVDNEYLDVQHAEQYMPHLHLQQYYQYVKALNNGISTVNLPWLASPEEIRTPYISYVMNTSETITVNSTGSMNLTELFKAYILQIANIASLPKSVLNDYMNITTNSTIDTIDNYDAVDVIVASFIENVLMKIYRVDSVIDSTGKQLHFVAFNNNLVTDDSYTLPLKITLTR